GDDDRRRRGDGAGHGVFPQPELQAFALYFEFREPVLAHEREDFSHVVKIHSSSRSVVTPVSTSTPCCVTSTSSSIRTPPQPGRYAPGSIVNTMPMSTSSSSG